ncbi:salivary glue protein Sgs-3-like [Saccostrea cucullata]|uniref:salivary glue protein Sgs-3-like n=1 Tax=Saccostrea cuccullata TaxID=36930 RepID=UPI002ED638AB
MAALFPNGTDEKCSCTKAFNLHYEGFTDYTTMDCVRYQHSSPYRGALAHLLDYQQAVRPTAQICHSHTSVWRELNNILQHNDRGERCLENLISHLYVSVFHQGDPCSCHAVSTTTKATTQPSTATITTTTSTTTTTLPSTTTTTTLPTTTNSPSTTTATTSKPTITSTETTNSHSTTTSKSSSSTPTVSSTLGQSTECSKIRTVTELAKFQQLYPEFNTNCTRRISTSNLIVRDLCDFVPISKFWKPGKRVVDACNTLKPYTPVATFSSSTYPLDGLAGVFLGCTNTSLRIATQECGGKFEIQEFARHATHFETFTHIASNFYEITY